MLKVIKSKCPANHKCPALKVCPVGALIQEGNDAPTVDNSLCIECGKCTNFCPMQALVIEKE